MSDEEDHSPSEFYYPDEIDVETTNELEVEKQNENQQEDENTANSQEQIENFIINQKAKNTIRKTKSDMNILHKYLRSIGKSTEIARTTLKYSFVLKTLRQSSFAWLVKLLKNADVLYRISSVSSQINVFVLGLENTIKI